MRFKKIIISLYDCEDPQKRMADIGFTFLFAVPHSIADCWCFYGCEIRKDKFKLPRDLYSAGMMRSPYELVGLGLSKEKADRLQLWIEDGE